MSGIAEPIIDITGVRKTFDGTEALAGVDLTAPSWLPQPAEASYPAPLG